EHLLGPAVVQYGDFSLVQVADDSVVLVHDAEDHIDELGAQLDRVVAFHGSRVGAVGPGLAGRAALSCWRPGWRGFGAGLLGTGEHGSDERGTYQHRYNQERYSSERQNRFHKTPLAGQPGCPGGRDSSVACFAGPGRSERCVIKAVEISPSAKTVDEQE